MPVRNSSPRSSEPNWTKHAWNYSCASGVPTDPNLKIAFIGDTSTGTNYRNVLNLIKGEQAAELLVLMIAPQLLQRIATQIGGSELMLKPLLNLEDPLVTGAVLAILTPRRTREQKSDT